MQMRTHLAFGPVIGWKQAVLALLVCASLLLPGQPGVFPTAASLAQGNLPQANTLAFAAGSASGTYVAMGAAGALHFQPDAVSLELPGSEGVQVQFLGTPGAEQLVASQPLAGVINRYTGSDPAQWQTSLPTFAALTYASLYPGIDLHYQGQEGRLKGTYLLEAGSSPAVIQWRYQGASRVWIEPSSGDLRIETASGRSLREHAPIAWQTIAGQQVPVQVAFQLQGDQVGFAVGTYHLGHPLVIDPTLVYGTYLGASNSDDIHAIAHDPNGNVIVTGRTYSPNFPGSTGRRNGNTDIFITKFNAQHALVFTTILGGNDDDDSSDIAVASSGAIWLTGTTESKDFPVVQPLNPLDFTDSWQKAFATQLSSSGALQMNTLMGLVDNNESKALALDPQGNAYFTGFTNAQYGPQAFVSKITADATQQVYLSLFGAAERGFNKGTEAYAIVVDAGGFAYITGRTNSIVFPVLDAYQPTCSEDDGYDCYADDAFLIKINPAGNDLVFGTYLGGGRGNAEFGTGSDRGEAIALDAQGNIFIAGETFSPFFPVLNAFQAAPAGADNFTDAFLTKFAPDGKTLLFSTYLGGEAWEELEGLVVDPAGNSYIAGFTSADNFPVSEDAIQRIIGRGFCNIGGIERYCYDAFLTGFNPSGALLTSTFLGGNNDDIVHDLAFWNGAVYLAGKTESHDLPTTNNGYQPNKALSEDGFVLQVQLAGGVVDPEPTPNPNPTPIPGSILTYLPFMQK